MRRAAAALVLLAAVPGTAQARTLHVRTSADLAAVQRTSRPGDRIVVHAGPRVLTGGIRLKPRQRLIGRGRPRLTNPAGDVVRLARRTVVRGLVIEGAGRGGIYGRNVKRAVIARNDVSGHNAECVPGFHIPPFNVPTTAPGVGVPISNGLRNGWAGIMVDAKRGKHTVVIRGNRVHHADCGDGIDVRAFGTARVRATIARNLIEELRQGPDFESVLAVGLQSRDSARLVARVDRNRQAGLGSDEDPGTGPEGADSEGVFVNPVGPSRLRATVTRNTYTHTPGRGGFSANGLEFVSMADGARAHVTVRDSTFSGTPGDVLEQLALGTNSTLTMSLEDVVATGSTGFAGSGFGNTMVIPGNNGDCLVAASGGAGNTVRTTIRDSELTDCANNGITFGSAVANGEGPTTDLQLDLLRSRVTGNRGNNLRVGNVSELDRVAVRVQDSDLSDAGGQSSLTPANASFENIGSTAEHVLDLGGGALGSTGGNCLDGGSLGLATLKYDVAATGNWWGGAPTVLPVGGAVATQPVLGAEPAHCRGALPRPDDDPFYVAPRRLAAAEPGAILRRRGIDVSAHGLPLPMEGHQILYRTTDTHGRPVATVATIIVAQGAPPAGGRPLLAYQPAEDSLTRDCASSYEIRRGENPELLQAVIPLLQDGAAIVVPDYEGPGSQWVAGHLAGHAVLDAIRATLRFGPAAASGRVAMWGYSGGGHATAWAAELHRSYAPGLDIVGVAHGGAPYDLRTTVAHLDGHPAAGILFAAVVGIGRAYPEMRLGRVLNDAGKVMREDIGDECIEEFSRKYAGARLDDFTKVPKAQDLPHVSRVIDHNDLGQRVPKAPTYLYHSATDELNPIAGADAIVAEYCRRGATVQYVREPAGEHIEYAIRGAAGAAAYLSARFAGEPAPDTCVTS